MSPKTRRFNVFDLMIMVAAIGTALVGVRSLWLGHIKGPGVIASKKMAYDRLLFAAMLSACATPMTVACLAFRLRRPRPGRRRMAIQPGTAAMLVCTVVFAARTLEATAALVLPDVYKLGGFSEMGRSSPIHFGDSNQIVLIRSMDRSGVIGSIEPFACHTVLVAGFAAPCGPAVAAVWLVIALGGRWRSERSWIDRLGRVLGITWIMISALAAYPV